MNNYPNLDVDEANIQEAIAQFYLFFGRMVRLRNDIEQLALDDQTKNRILDQLEDIESEYFILVFGVLKHSRLGTGPIPAFPCFALNMKGLVCEVTCIIWPIGRW